MKTYIAGINGMVGSSISRKFRDEKIEVFGKSSKELDFTNREDTFRELNAISPDVLIIAAAKVGGIGANSTYPVEFLTLNLQLQTNLLDAAHEANIGKVIFLGSSCIYPKFAPQPIPESSLLTGPLEPTNEPYAIAKIAGIKLERHYKLDAPRGVAGRNSDNRKIKQYLSWEPSTSLSEGIAATYKWIEAEFGQLHNKQGKDAAGVLATSSFSHGSKAIPGDGYVAESRRMDTWRQGIPAGYGASGPAAARM